MRASARFVRWFVLVSTASVAAGCASAPLDIPTYPLRPQPVSVTAQAPRVRPAPRPVPGESTDPVRPTSATEPISPSAGLDELLTLARTRNPDLATAAARVGEARGRMVQAGLYPNPTVGYSGNQINDGPGTAGQQGGFVAQEFVTGGKLKIARESARYGVTAADWHAASRWF